MINFKHSWEMPSRGVLQCEVKTAGKQKSSSETPPSSEVLQQREAEENVRNHPGRRWGGIPEEQESRGTSRRERQGDSLEPWRVSGRPREKEGPDGI